MVRTVLRGMVAGALVLQFGCQMSQSANTETRKEQRFGNDTKRVAAVSVKLLPVDEGPQDSSFADFRDKLLTAVKSHDVEFVLSILDGKIINGSDTERGVREFKTHW